MKRIIVLIFFILGGISLSGQDKWTLDRCLDYAVENNIALKRQQVITENYRNELRASRANLLPNLNFSSRANLNFGRSVDPVTNNITFNQNILNSYSIGSGVTLLNGFAGLNRMSAARFLYEMGVELYRQQVDLLSLDIINAYYEVLMSKGTVRTATEQLAVSEKQLRRVEVLVNTGGESRTTLFEMQSQVSSNRLMLTQSINNEMLAIERLRQLLQIDPGQQFDIDEQSLLVSVPVNDENNPDSIYHIAKDILPSIQALELKKSAMKKQLSAAVGDATPELSLSAGWGTGYFDAMTEGVETLPFHEQLKINSSQSIQATLQIPIFNRWFYGKNIKQAKLNLEDARLELEQGLNTLYQQVNISCLEVEAAYQEYLSARDNLDFSDIAYKAVEKKFNTGMANATEFAEARRQKFASEVDFLRTKLQYNLKLMTVEFYLTGEWQVK